MGGGGGGATFWIMFYQLFSTPLGGSGDMRPPESVLLFLCYETAFGDKYLLNSCFIDNYR